MKTDTQCIVAALHGVVEDCPNLTIESLRNEGFSATILEAVDGLTRRKGESYEAFIGGVPTMISRAS